MNCLIIGSVAMYHWFPDARVPNDIDLLTPAKISGNRGGACVVDSQWHDVAEELIQRSTDKVFADPNILYTLKVSHSYWNIHHDKTLFDVKFLQDKGAVLYPDLHQKLIQEWTKIHGAQTQANVTLPMAEFFKDAVHREYDHEWLHTHLAFYDRPIHERIRPDISTVRCSHELFEALSVDDQARCALEEIMTTAVERANLRGTSKNSEILSAMKMSHRKLCTTMAKGWFALYNVQNHFVLLHTRRNEWLPHLKQRLTTLPAPTQPRS